MAQPTHRWNAGESILYRDIDEHHQIVSSVRPVRVVRDDEDLVALWLPLGTRSIKPVLIHHSPGTPRRWVEGNWYLTESTWKWAECLILIRPGQRHATWVKWSDTREFQGWYINLQSDLTRTRLGFDIWDHQLDIVVSPDRKWHLKDENELEFAVELGRMTSAQVTEVRAEAALAIEEIEHNGSPFSDGWENWRPHPTWELPQLRTDWDDLTMYEENRSTTSSQ